MHYRIPVVLAMIMAAISLSAPAAFASTQPLLANSCTPGQTFGPFHVMANSDNHLVGITYHGPGNLITATSTPGDSSFECVGSPDIYVIHNNAGNCFRMRDASNDYTVIEESGCQTGNTNYQFQASSPSAGLYQFKNIHFGQWLGTEHCPSSDGDVVEGLPNAPGNCVTWVLQ